ncbi:hypothetical protein AAFF_G00285510 [Aldrovandia affinis]|uniref:Uncharacterized protein n=1 Tax=Aldrovandia affinis TaxID=143900 RepID=A0AAD7TAD6_9TELE|nr:hypothetical protein AAFF_G00285510 [Aldrovandia affinis]
MRRPKLGLNGQHGVLTRKPQTVKPVPRDAICHAPPGVTVATGKTNQIEMYRMGSDEIDHISDPLHPRQERLTAQLPLSPEPPGRLATLETPARCSRSSGQNTGREDRDGVKYDKES